MPSGPMRDKAILTVPADAVSTAIGRAIMDRTPAAVGWLVTAVRGAAFWAAIFFPLVYLPMLLGETGPVAPSLLGKYVCLHALSLFVGHVYDGVVGTLNGA